MSEKAVTGYMCKVSWDYEIGEALGGNQVYPSIEDLKANCQCWQECGIVQVEVRLKQVIRGD